ncbi:unnamed protein product, partial [Urochloa humidicola]
VGRRRGAAAPSPASTSADPRRSGTGPRWLDGGAAAAWRPLSDPSDEDGDDDVQILVCGMDGRRSPPHRLSSLHAVLPGGADLALPSKLRHFYGPWGASEITSSVE